MKNIILILFVAIMTFATAQGQVAINTTGSAPAASAMLDVTSTTKGLLVPRMTKANRLAISSPAQGLLVYQTDGQAGFYLYNGTAWKQEVNMTEPTTTPAAGSMLSFDGTNWVTKSIATGLNATTNNQVSQMQPYLVMNWCIAMQGIWPQQSGPDPYIGEVELFAFQYAPMGWNKCDGSLQSIQMNSALFALIGTTYGGDGQNTFALPDLRGRVPISQGQGPGLTYRTMGEQAGAESFILNLNNIPPHTHPIIQY